MKIFKILLFLFLLSTFYFLPSITYADITTNLVGHWSFDDGTASDQSGNGNDGTLVGGVATTTGKIGDAFSFDGVDDYVDVGDIDLTDAFTISAWVNVNDLSGKPTIVAKSYSSYQFFILPDGAVRFQRNSTTEITTNNLVTTGNWHHIISTFDTTDGMVVYLDGVNVGTSDILDTTGINDFSTKIGIVGTKIMNGLMDDVRIYDRALTPTDVTELYNYRGDQAQAPSATTNAITNLTETTTTLNGTVNPNGADTTVYFEYGTASGSYTNQTSSQIITGSSNTAVSDSINLDSGFFYYYRTVAVNEADTVYGSEMSFDLRDLYTHDTVTEPLYDEARLIIPTELANNEMAQLGFVDVTASPFNADKTGNQDATNAIKTAANLARDYQMVLYFPLGTYKISDTVDCIQGYYRRQNGKILGSRTFFCSWMGESSTVGQRPKIVLAPSSSGFNDSNNPKYAVHFWTRDPDANSLNAEKGGLAFNQKFSNIDIDTGSGNSGAVGIRMMGAEGSGVTDVDINATNSYAGAYFGPGSSGYYSNVTITGGRIGIDLIEAKPVPALVDVKLINQTETAIIYSGLETLNAVGLDITSQTAGPVIKSQPAYNNYNYGPISIADSKITFTGNQPNTIAIGTANRSMYLNNVYIQGADSVLTNPDGTDFPANKDGWIKVSEYAYKVTPPLSGYYGEGIQYYHSVYVDGVESDNIVDYEIDVAPPSDLISQHIWDDTFPHWDTQGAVNVKTAYGAKGDGYTDDTTALQNAIDQNEIVFLPKGFYRISSTIKLKSNTKLVGIDPYFSNIIIRNDESYFTDPNNAKPLVETYDSSTADTIIDGIGIYVPRDYPGAYALKWQSGGSSVVRRVKPRTVPSFGLGAPISVAPYDAQRSHPLTLITNNGGGKWYSQYGEFAITHPDYRHILVDGIEGPLTFYTLQSQYALSDAITEIRNSKYVTVFGLKGEGKRPVIKVKDSDHIRIFAYGGNGAPELDYPLYQIENVPNLTLANLINRTRFNVVDYSASTGPGRHPSEFNFLKEITPDGQNIATPFFERPVVYKRGNALASAYVASQLTPTISGGGNYTPPVTTDDDTATTTVTTTPNQSDSSADESDDMGQATTTENSSEQATYSFSTAPGSSGNETGYFGILTQKAVQRFQTKYNIVTSGTPETTGFGRVGPSTIAKLKELFGL